MPYLLSRHFNRLCVYIGAICSYECVLEVSGDLSGRSISEDASASRDAAQSGNTTHLLIDTNNDRGNFKSSNSAYDDISLHSKLPRAGETL